MKFWATILLAVTCLLLPGVTGRAFAQGGRFTPQQEAWMRITFLKWVESNSNTFSQIVAQTNYWNGSAAWVGTHSNHVQYMETRTSTWDSVSAYVGGHTSAWDLVVVESVTNGALVAGSAFGIAKSGRMMNITFPTNITAFTNDAGYLTTTSTNDFATTNWVDLWYYPRNNPSNYVTASVTNGLWNYTDGTNWVDAGYYPRNNPSNYVTASVTNGLWDYVSGTNWVTDNFLTEAIAEGLYDALGASAAVSNWVSANYYPRNNPSNYVTASITNDLPYVNTNALIAGLNSNATINGAWIFTNNVTIPETPVEGTDAASKHYVDLQIDNASIHEWFLSTNVHATLGGSNMADVISGDYTITNTLTTTNEIGTWWTTNGMASVVPEGVWTLHADTRASLTGTGKAWLYFELLGVTTNTLATSGGDMYLLPTSAGQSVNPHLHVTAETTNAFTGIRVYGVKTGVGTVITYFNLGDNKTHLATPGGINGGSGGVSDHAALSNLSWSNSAHTGAATVTNVAGFQGGTAVEIPVVMADGALTPDADTLDSLHGVSYAGVARNNTFSGGTTQSMDQASVSGLVVRTSASLPATTVGTLNMNGNWITPVGTADRGILLDSDGTVHMGTNQTDIVTDQFTYSYWGNTTFGLIAFNGTPSFGGRRSSGVPGSPTATASNVALATLYGGGYDTNWTGSRGYVTVQTAELFAGGANGTQILMGTTPRGSVNRSTRFIVQPDGTVNFVPLAAFPASPATGDTMYHSVSNKLFVWNGSIWSPLN